MKNEINNISKKKSFLGEFLKEYVPDLIVAFGFLYFTVAGIIGNLVSKEDNIVARILNGLMTGFFVAFGIIAVLGIIALIYWDIKTNINRIKAIKRYIYLPLPA